MEQETLNGISRPFGRLAPLQKAIVPTCASVMALLGPGLVWASLSQSSGELIWWPYLTVKYRDAFLWLILPSLALQFFVNDKQTLATCDLGVTGVDFAIPDTGTLGLLSSAEQPRAVSLLPRVHLALLRPAALRADLHQVFAQAKAHPYLIFITGPSRTADIELTVTLGVHGPQELYVWAMG